MCRILFGLTLFVSIVHFTSAQGCSDAGFCTMGAMKPDQYFRKGINIRLRSLEFSQYVGLTRLGDVVVNYTADASVSITEQTAIQIKLPYVWVDGPLARNAGIGDLSLTLTQNIFKTDDYQVAFSLGSKMPTGDVTGTSPEGRPLPMYNQTGLGTYDLIAGISMVTEKWMFAAGYQHAFGRNESEFVWGSWAGTPQEEHALAYPRARSLKRGEDIMLRVERNFRFLNWNFNLGLLPIYRINRDQFKLPILDGAGNMIGEENIHLDGSNGLALTLLVGGGYQFNARSGIKVMNGFRLVKRDKNPDGLSREYVSNIGYVYRF